MDTSPLPHTRIRDDRGRIVLEIDDAELADWLDDQLTETFGLCIDGFQEIGSQTRFWFFSGQVLEEVLAALGRIDPAEAERIFRINNHTDKSSLP